LDPFRLTDAAILDIDAIWLYLLEKEGVEPADPIVTDSLKVFTSWLASQTAGTAAPISRASRFFSTGFFPTSSFMNPEASPFRFSGSFTESGT
jgi:plasmid stabilization system protein ParE